MPRSLIAFSGLDGAGKSTQIRILADSLFDSGVTPKVIWSRGGYTPGFEAVKKIGRALTGEKVIPPSGMNPTRDRAFGHPMVRKIWLTLAILDLIFLYAVVVRWWRLMGQIIICDRYLWDTQVDFELNFPQEAITSWLLWKILVSLTPQPDHAFLLVIPLEESLRRSDLKGEPFRDSKETLSRRMKRYQKLSRQGEWIVVDCMRPVLEIADEIAGHLGIYSINRNDGLV